MLDKNEVIQLTKACDSLPNPVEFTFYQAEESDFSRKLKNFVDELCRLSQGKIRAAAGRPDSGIGIFPCFRMRFEDRASVTYAAVPSGHQFPPFIDYLRLIGDKSSGLADGKTASAGSPAELQVLISEHCPHCPLVVKAALQLSSRYSTISSFIVDAAQFPKITQEYGIKSVPAAVLDRRLVLIGNVSGERLLELVKIRGTSKFEVEVVQSLIDTGRISEAAGCLDRDAGRSVILALIRDPDFSKRLSGLVVIEKALEDNPDTVRILVPDLVEMLSHDDSRIRGDIADLLGRIGDPQVIPQLEPLVADPDPDVAEAAADAIGALRNVQTG